MIVLSICNEPENIVKEEHICYFAKNGGDNSIIICELLERCYKHPDAPEEAIIPVLEVDQIKTFRRSEIDAGVAVLLEACENATSIQINR